MPVKHSCANLQSRQTESRGRANIINTCPNRGWFNDFINQWSKWNVTVHYAAIAEAPSSKCSRRNACTWTIHSRGASSTDDVVARRELQARENERLTQIHDDHARAIRVKASMEACTSLLSTAQAVATALNADEVPNFELVAAEVTALRNKLSHSPQICKCVVCYTSIFRDSAAFCSRGLHALCSSCFEAYARAEQQQQESVIYERGARLLCPCRLPHDAECMGWFSEQSMAAFLPVHLYQVHLDQQRQQMHAEESVKFNGILNQIAKKLEQDMPGISRELLQRQFQAALPGARQCGGCGFGPVEHYACDNLQSHHNESRGRATINNACPKCGWFSANIRQWPKWNGIVHSAVIDQAPSTDHGGQNLCTRINYSQAASSTEDPIARELEAMEEARFVQMRADYVFAQHLSRDDMVEFFS